MKVVATFHVHPKRVGQITDLARGLSSQLALEAPTEIEVITDETNVEATEVAIVEDASIPAAANDGGNDTGSEVADTASSAPAAKQTKAKVKPKTKGR